MQTTDLDKRGPFFNYLKNDDAIDYQNPEALSFRKGEMTGRFEMGSTIVLIFEASLDTELNVHEGKRLLLGNSITSTKN